MYSKHVIGNLRISICNLSKRLVIMIHVPRGMTQNFLCFIFFLMIVEALLRDPFTEERTIWQKLLSSFNECGHVMTTITGHVDMSYTKEDYAPH